MDLMSWGEHQHKLHYRVAPLRASEYGIPIFKVCSSGISQFTDKNGAMLATAPFPGQEEILTATLPMASAGTRPLDRHFFWPAILMLIGFFAFAKKAKESISS
jgi:apolipoprotein N-acyltransferase